MAFPVSMVQAVLLATLLFHYTSSLPVFDGSLEDVQALSRIESSFFTQDYSDSLVADERSSRRPGLQTRQLGDIEFTNRYAEYLKSKAKLTSICSFLRRMQNGKKSEKALRVEIECQKDGSIPTTIDLIVAIINVNDNPPVFAEAQYSLNVDELTSVGETVGKFEASDPDGDRLYYSLQPTTEGFRLGSELVPNIEVDKLLDYEKVKQVTLTLTARDTPTGQPPHTATTTVIINIVDIDNRPPWFQPCTETDLGTSKICLNSGYRGKVDLNQIEPGNLPLEPGPVYAIDGDTTLNAPIGYKIAGGNEAGIFQIGETTGHITMLKPAGIAGPITLTVLAFQVSNPDQFATTTVTFDVVLKTANPPEFLKSSYEGYISVDAGPGSLVMESKNSRRPLRVEATDLDFENGINPNIRFEILGTSDFRATQEGFVLMETELTPGILEFEMRVVDEKNGESNKGLLSVEVAPGLVTTTTFTTTNPSTTTPSTITTSPTATPTVTSAVTTQSTDRPVSDFTTDSLKPSNTKPSPGGDSVARGGFDSGDMAALGASLAILLVICLVAVILLALHIRKGNKDWKKVSEASMFRKTLEGSFGGQTGGIQYTNEGFQHDTDTVDTVSVDFKHNNEITPKQEPEVRVLTTEKPTSEKLSQLPVATSQDTESLAGSESLDGEKEVKPILTKERRNEDGYKSVWFKADIDPSANEEVVIIADSSEHDGEEDEDEEEGGDDVARPRSHSADSDQEETQDDGEFISNM
ncbi:cadherin-related family member 5 [Chanos chanos]|uniref:Cadherin-related family member 5 n=1 Tax=Chanos chanos TaxID=29144 RepID=A0A6J2VFS8_CHACN|nr:cadherin-related family member 5-like [Chanos chanos]